MEPVLVAIWPDAARALGIGRTKMFELIGNGDIPTVVIGSRRLVPLDELRSFASRLPAVSEGEPMTRTKTGGPIDGRSMKVTLGAAAATVARTLAKRYGESPAEIVRRALSLLSLYANLPSTKHLAIVDSETGEMQPLKPTWDAHPGELRPAPPDEPERG